MPPGLRLPMLAALAALLAPALPAVAPCGAILAADPVCVLGVEQEDLAPSGAWVRIQPPQATVILGGQAVVLGLAAADGSPLPPGDARFTLALFALDAPGLGGDVRLLPGQNVHRALWSASGALDADGRAAVGVPRGLGYHVVLLYGEIGPADGPARAAFYDAASEALAASGHAVPQASLAASPVLLLP